MQYLRSFYLYFLSVCFHFLFVARFSIAAAVLQCNAISFTNCARFYAQMTTVLTKGLTKNAFFGTQRRWV